MQVYSRLIIIVLLINLCGCISAEDRRRVSFRPESVQLLSSLEVQFETDVPDRASIFSIPAGHYTVFHETKRDVFYLCQDGEITKRWIYPVRGHAKLRTRKGGLVFSKRAGSWWIFTKGPIEDIIGDGMPTIGLLSQDKAGDDYLNVLGPTFTLIDRDGVVRLPAVALGSIPLD